MCQRSRIERTQQFASSLDSCFWTKTHLLDLAHSPGWTAIASQRLRNLFLLHATFSYRNLCVTRARCCNVFVLRETLTTLIILLLYMICLNCGGPGIVQCCRMLQVVAGCYRPLQGVSRNATRDSVLITSSSRCALGCCSGLHVLQSQYCRVLQCVSSDSSILCLQKTR